jgi:membrane protease YdiL (CAAX protease family)
MKQFENELCEKETKRQPLRGSEKSSLALAFSLSTMVSVSSMAVLGCDSQNSDSTEGTTTTILLNDSLSNTNTPQIYSLEKSAKKLPENLAEISKDKDRKTLLTFSLKEYISNPSLYEYAITLIQTLTVLGISIAITNILNRSKIKTGNPSLQEELLSQEHEAPAISKKESQLKIFGEAVFFAPLLEEALFRLIPAILFDFATSFKKHNDIPSNIGIGLVTAAIFASVHNIVKDGSGRLKLNLTSIPVQSFIAGLFLWYLMKVKGFDHALLAHAFNNAFGCTMEYFKVPFPDFLKLIKGKKNV